MKNKMKIDIFEVLENYNADPEAFKLIMGGTPEELYPEEMAELDDWLETVESK